MDKVLTMLDRPKSTANTNIIVTSDFDGFGIDM